MERGKWIEKRDQVSALTEVERAASATARPDTRVHTRANHGYHELIAHRMIF